MQRTKLIFISLVICFTSHNFYGQEKQFWYDDSLRTYVIYEPVLDPKPEGYPLVIGLHGTGADGAIFIATASLVQKANKEKFIVSCPNALMNNLFTYFNCGGSFEELTNGTDDVGFISALIDTMIKNYNVDTTKIYIMGFSNGSAMSYRVAAELSHKIAAIGAVSGQMVYEYCDPEYPVPIIHFHGLSDDLIPFEGNDENIPSVDSIMAIWRGINHCSSIPDTIVNKNGIIGKKWASFDGKGDIVLYTIQDQEHEWPRPATLGISATDVIWDFLILQNRSSLTHIKKDFTQSVPMNFKLYQNYPNPFNPFNPLTVIKYKLTKSSHIVFKIYNLAGQEIETLVNELQPAGEYKITWQPKGLPSGLYFYKIQAGEFSETKKIILQK